MIKEHAQVPQGSVLGPLLFCCLINDLSTCLDANTECHMYMYADDTNIIVASSNLHEIEHHLNNVASACAEWCLINRMVINTSKTKVMIMSSRKGIFDTTVRVRQSGSLLDQVESAKILGIFVSSDITTVQNTVDSHAVQKN